MNTLATPELVKKLTNVTLGYAPTTIQPYLVLEENALARECLGIEFYAELLADKVVYAAPFYSSQTAYIIGDVVQYDGWIYECIQDSTNNIPTNALFWQTAPLFASTCFNSLWNEGFLSYFICWSVAVRMAANFTGTIRPA